MAWGGQHIPACFGSWGETLSCLRMLWGAAISCHIPVCPGVEETAFSHTWMQGQLYPSMI